MTCHMSDTRIDPREVMTDDEALHALMHCEDEQSCQFCNADKACVECIDGELYGTITTTQTSQLPTPQDIVTFLNTNEG